MAGIGSVLWSNCNLSFASPLSIYVFDWNSGVRRTGSNMVGLIARRAFSLLLGVLTIRLLGSLRVLKISGNIGAFEDR
jgi:hypothetical protein